MLFLFFKSDDFKGTYALLSKSVDKNPAKFARGVTRMVTFQTHVTTNVFSARYPHRSLPT